MGYKKEIELIMHVSCMTGYQQVLEYFSEVYFMRWKGKKRREVKLKMIVLEYTCVKINGKR